MGIWKKEIRGKITNQILRSEKEAHTTTSSLDRGHDPRRWGVDGPRFGPRQKERWPNWRRLIAASPASRGVSSCSERCHRDDIRANPTNLYINLCHSLYIWPCPCIFTVRWQHSLWTGEWKCDDHRDWSTFLALPELTVLRTRTRRQHTPLDDQTKDPLTKLMTRQWLKEID